MGCAQGAASVPAPTHPRAGGAPTHGKAAGTTRAPGENVVLRASGVGAGTDAAPCAPHLASLCPHPPRQPTKPPHPLKLRMNITPPGFLLILAAIGILPPPQAFAQYNSGTYGSGSSGSYGSGSSGSSSYIPSGPAASMQMSGYLNFQVPLGRAGHSFSLQWRNGSGTPQPGSASAVGIATGTSVVGGPNSPLYLAVAAPPPTYPSLPSEWWLVDTTAQQEARHQTYGLLNANWHATAGVQDSYFAIPASRLGHSLVVGSVLNGWTPLNQGQVLGTYVVNGSTVQYQPGTWFEAWRPTPAPGYWVTDLTTAQKASVGNVTDVSQVPWVTDATIYPMKDVTFYLDAAELDYHYSLHWKIATLEVVLPVTPQSVAAQFDQLLCRRNYHPNHPGRRVEDQRDGGWRIGVLGLAGL